MQEDHHGGVDRCEFGNRTALYVNGRFTAFPPLPGVLRAVGQKVRSTTLGMRPLGRRSGRVPTVGLSCAQVDDHAQHSSGQPCPWHHR